MPFLNEESFDREKRKFRENPTETSFLKICETYRKKGELKKAHLLCLKGMKFFPNSASSHLTLARIFMDLEKYDSCIDQAQQALLIEAYNLAAYSLMGEAYLSKKDYHQALRAYKILLFYKPRDKKASSKILEINRLIHSSSPYFSQHQLEKYLMPFVEALMSRGDFKEAESVLEKSYFKTSLKKEVLKKLKEINPEKWKTLSQTHLSKTSKVTLKKQDKLLKLNHLLTKVQEANELNK